MTTTVKVQNLTNIGNITDGDKLVGERIAGQTRTITINGILYDADFITNGFITRTASAVYANRTMTGTSNKITVTNGDGISGNPTFDISSNYAGQNTITTLGTVTTGTWNASIVGLLYGGTNSALTASNGGIVYSDATKLQILSGVATAQKILMSQVNTAPIWSTATYPTATTLAGTLMRSDGSNWVQSTITLANAFSANDIVFCSSTNNLSAVTSQNNSVFITNAGGVPSWGTTLPIVALGTPSSGNLSNCTNYPISQLSGAAAGILTFLATPSSENLAAAVTNETGSGALVFATSPTLTTPNIGVATGTSFNGLTGAAVQSDQETASSTTTIVTPSVQKFHPSSAKAWAHFGTTGNIITSYNVSSITDSGVGLAVVNFTTSFSAANYGMGAIVGGGSTVVRTVMISTLAAGSASLSCTDGGGTLADPAGTNTWHICFFGDQ